MANEKDALRLGVEESTFNVPDNKEYQHSLCFPTKKKGYLQRQRSARNGYQNVEEGVDLYDQYKSTSLKVSVENDYNGQSPRSSNVKIKYPEEHSLEDVQKYAATQEENIEHHDPVDDIFDIPESLDQELTQQHIWPQTYEEEKTQLDGEQLKNFLCDSSKETLSYDSIDVGDVIEMHGMFGQMYDHYAIVESKNQHGLELAEYTSRSGRSALLLVIFFACVFLDPLAALAKAKTSSYTYRKLENRKAKKISFPKEAKKYIDNKETQNKLERRKTEPDFLYSLELCNCEHYAFDSVFGIPVSHQLDKSKIQLFIMNGCYSIIAAIHLVIFGILPSHLGISWIHVCFFHEIYLSCYHTWKLRRLKKQERITETKSEEELSSIWTRALITIVFNLFGGLAMRPGEPPWIPLLVIITGNVLGLCHKLFVIKCSWLLKLSWVLAVVCYTVWWNPFGMLTVIFKYIIETLRWWLTKCALICLILKLITSVFQ